MYVHSMLNQRWVNHKDSIKKKKKSITTDRTINNKNMKTNHFNIIIVLFSVYVSKFKIK